MEKQLENISEMENILSSTTDLVQKMGDLLSQWENNIPEFKKLMDYYGSKQWHDDIAAFDEGKIPKNLPCGILSEDGIYNVYGDFRALSIQLIKAGTSGVE